MYRFRVGFIVSISLLCFSAQAGGYDYKQILDEFCNNEEAKRIYKNNRLYKDGTDSLEIYNLFKKKIDIDLEDKNVHQQTILHILCGDRGIKKRITRTARFILGCVLHEMLEEKTDMKDKQDVNGMTPLHHAIKQGNMLFAQILLHHKADPNIQDSKKKTPVFYVYTDKDTYKKFRDYFIKELEEKSDLKIIDNSNRTFQDYKNEFLSDMQGVRFNHKNKEQEESGSSHYISSLYVLVKKTLKS